MKLNPHQFVNEKHFILMNESDSSNFHSFQTSNSAIISPTQEFSNNFSDLSVTDKTKKCQAFDMKKTKEKPKSRPKDILKRLFLHKSNSKHPKSPKELSPTQAIAKATLDIFAQSPVILNNNDIKLTPTTTQLSVTNLPDEDSFNESVEFKTSSPNSDNQPEISASVASLESFHIVPKIFEEPASTRNSLLLSEPFIENQTHLNLPENDRSRKSSDNDSAVDLKFTDDLSDQDRTNISENGSSRCPSGLLVTGDEYPSTITSDSNKLQVSSTNNKVKRTDSSSSWRKIKAALVWTPFIQQCARYKYPWIQIAGHQGNFKPGEQGTILKKYSGRESICLQMMVEDILSDFVPQFKCDIDYEGEKYICMQDLLANFNRPSLIDIKMGTRTYLEEELVKAKHCPKPRLDMYEKMIEIDENEPTEEEHRTKAILKPRYMQWRETLSSTINLGFRVEGVKKVIGTQSRDYKRTKDRKDVKEILTDFIDKHIDVLETFIKRLEDLKIALGESTFFWEHEFIGSSLLFVHDNTGNANIWMIDFGKTIPLPPTCKIDHYSRWVEGNHEDGYLYGLDNLLNILQEIHSEITNK